MANPYAGTGTAAGALANVRGDIGDDQRPGGLPAADSTLPPLAVLLRIGRFMRPRLPLLAVASITSAASVVLQLFVPILTGRAIDDVVGPGAVDFVALRSTLVAMAVIVLASALSRWLADYAISRISNETVCDLRTRAFDKLDRLPVSFLDAHPHGDLLARVTFDVDQMGDGLVQGITQLLVGLVTIVATLAFMFSLSVPVGLIVVVITPLSVAVAALIARHSSASFAEQQALAGELTAHVEEYVGNQRLVDSFGFGTRAQRGFDAINARLRGIGERAQFVSSLSNPSTRLVNNVTYAVVAVVGCLCVVSGVPDVLSVGEVQSFLSYANQYMKPFNEVSAVVTQVQAAFASARRLLALLDADELASDPSDADDELAHVAGALSFEGVSFSYRKDQPLLRDVTFSAEPGQRIALVGSTGCGKTTLINLLLRFYEVDGGVIRVDGRDVRRISRRRLRACFGMVLQETWLFGATVRENIAYGREDASFEDVVTAARRAHADTFIRQLPNGYDTVLGEEGTMLSQGQCQLLCIARAMLADAPILLLDEATSSIDTRTELQVQAAFDEMMRGRTSLVVAHRLSTVRDADCILVMDGGRIGERGTHEELLAHDGLYARLYRSQFAAGASPVDP